MSDTGDSVEYGIFANNERVAGVVGPVAWARREAMHYAEQYLDDIKVISVEVRLLAGKERVLDDPDFR